MFIAHASYADKSRLSTRIIFLLRFLLLGMLASSVIAAQTSGEKKPPNVYVDKGACPFECCTYREWEALADVAILDTPNGEKTVGRVKKGEKVEALTGEVHSVPLRVVVRHDYPDSGVKAGDAVYVLHYEGEGYWKVWHDGKALSVADFSEEGPEPKSTWWVKLKTRSGVVGWTVSHGNFGNQDACG